MNCDKLWPPTHTGWSENIERGREGGSMNCDKLSGIPAKREAAHI